MSRGGEGGISSSVAYRVRGSSVASEDSGNYAIVFLLTVSLTVVDWVEPLSAEDEEKELRKHLAAAKVELVYPLRYAYWNRKKWRAMRSFSNGCERRNRRPRSSYRER